MTLTAALRLALDPATHPSNLTLLRQIVTHVVTDPADAPRGLVSRVLLFGLALVTLSGTTESLRAIVKEIDDVIPWCPADLWDSGEVTL